MLFHLILAWGRRLSGGVLAEQAVFKRANTSVSPVFQDANCFITYLDRQFRH